MPAGGYVGAYGGGWAVLDLVLLALALYVLFPVLSLKRKADRVRELAGKGRAALAVEAEIGRAHV